MITLGRFIKLLNMCGIRTGANSGSYAMTGTWVELVAAHAATPFADGTNLLCSSGLGFVVRPVGGLLMVSTPQIGRQSISSSSGVVTIDLHSGYYSNELTLTENVTSWSFTNLPSTGEVIEKLVPIIQHASAAKTVVSPATTGRTAGGIAWVADTTLSSREVLVIRVDANGTVSLFPTGRQV